MGLFSNYFGILGITAQLFCRFSGFPETRPPARAVVDYKLVKTGNFAWLCPPATFVRCVMGWDVWVKVAGPSPAGGIPSKMCECVNALRVLRLHVR